MLRKTFIALISAVATMGASLSAAEQTPPAKLPLRVLYAGNAGSNRAQDFAALFEKHFAKTTVVPLAEFKPSDADGHDVVIFDWTSIYPRGKDGRIDNKAGNISTPQAPRLPQTFSRPTILIGAAGGHVAGSLQLKINWL